jgi:hypothetical protein
MKTYKIESFTVCTMGSYWDTYYSTGKDLKEAKVKLVKKLGCTKTYFDDTEYNKITLIKTDL